MKLFKLIFLFTLFTAVSDSALHAQSTTHEVNLLNELNQKYLVNPIGKKRVKVWFKEPTCWGGDKKIADDGWLDEKTGRVYFTYKNYIPVKLIDSIVRVNFLDSCRKVYSYKAEKKEEDVPAQFHPYVVCGENDLTLAAWLLALGYKELSEQAFMADKAYNRPYLNLKEGEDEFSAYRKQTLTRIKEGLLWMNYDGLLNNYIVRRDSLALVYAKQLKQLTDTVYEQTNEIITDLNRRLKKGTFGREPDTLPKNFSEWTTDKKINFLIETFDEFDARQAGQPGGIIMDWEWRYAELTKIGEPAIPALINAIESDMRLTRTLTFWRDFSHDRYVWPVWRVALSAVSTILQTQEFTDRFVRERYSEMGMKGRKKIAGEIRDYCKKYNNVDYADRFLAILKDSSTTAEKLEETIENISKLSPAYYKPNIGYMDVTKEERKRDSISWRRILVRYENPTVAESMLTAFDRALALNDVGTYRYDERMKAYCKKDITRKFILDALVDFNDKRITPALVKRYTNENNDLTLKRRYAYAAFCLGDTSALLDYSKKMEEGSFVLPGLQSRPYAYEEPAYFDLGETMYLFVKSGLPQAEKTIWSFANENHPYHQLWVNSIRENSKNFDYSTFYWHYHVSVLPVIISGISGALSQDQQPYYLLSTLICGFPCGEGGFPGINVEESKAFIKRFTQFRKMTGEEQRLGSIWGQWNEPYFIPDIPELDHAATEKDVEEGRAIFQLGGKGKKANIKLPAAGILKADVEKADPERIANGSIYFSRMLIYQAETDEAGNLYYGVITKHEIKMIKGEELVDVKPIQ